MKKYSYLISEQDPAGSLGKESDYIIAVYHGKSKEDAVKNIIRTIAKHLAKGDITRILEKEALVEKEKDTLARIIYEDLEGGTYFEDTLIYIEPFDIKENSIDFDSKEIHHYGRTVIFDEETNRYHDESDFPDGCDDKNAYFILFVTGDCYDSPFFYPTPFILRRGGAVAVDAETGQESEMLEKIQRGDDFYIVYRNGKAGVVSSSGKVLLDCVYDNIDWNYDYAILWKDYKIGLFDPQHNLLIPCEYDDIDFPDSESGPDYIHAWKRGEKGLLATDGSFHPLTGDDPDSKFDYLLA